MEVEARQCGCISSDDFVWNKRTPPDSTGWNDKCIPWWQKGLGTVFLELVHSAASWHHNTGRFQLIFGTMAWNSLAPFTGSAWLKQLPARQLDSTVSLRLRKKRFSSWSPSLRPRITLAGVHPSIFVSHLTGQNCCAYLLIKHTLERQVELPWIHIYPCGWGSPCLSLQYFVNLHLNKIWVPVKRSCMCMRVCVCVCPQYVGNQQHLLYSQHWKHHFKLRSN